MISKGTFLHDVSNGMLVSKGIFLFYTTLKSGSPGIDGGVVEAHLRAKETGVGVRLEMERTCSGARPCFQVSGQVPKVKNQILVQTRMIRVLRRSRGHSLSGVRECIAIGVEKTLTCVSTRGVSSWRRGGLRFPLILAVVRPIGLLFLVLVLYIDDDTRWWTFGNRYEPA